jgi:predicted acetyltransferase
VACAYVTFAFKHEPGMPFFGEIVVTGLAYDGPEAFLAVLGLLWRLRAKVGHVTLELCDDIDLATILPDGDNLERTSVDFAMLRVLDVCRALELMEVPEAEGGFALEVDDAFMPENSGVYQVRIASGHVRAERGGTTADLHVSVQTLCLLAIGRIGLAEALLREGTQLLGKRELLARVFVKRPVHFAL